ncbi:MAG: ATP-binding cassette domain-containing protein [Desulforhopalus sp.]
MERVVDPSPLLIAMYIKNYCHQELTIDLLSTAVGQSWCILGDNQSGIDRLLTLLGGDYDSCSADALEVPENLQIITFQRQQELFEEELRNDDSDFLDRIDPGTLVREFLPDYASHLALLKSFGLDKCLDLGYRQLSSGQSRKLLLLQKLTNGSRALIIQNPYDGLDEQSCRELDSALRQLSSQSIELLLFINSVNDIPAWCSHLALIDAGRLVAAGPKAEVTKLFAGKLLSPNRGFSVNDAYLEQTTLKAGNGEELVHLREGFAAYGDKKLFQGLDLTISTGDHTLITGPNGCGKSTLLDIITGDNPKCYANSLRIFGRQRGTGESIWDIKNQMGIVSPTLHRNHRVPGNPIHVILSGLHDSIGLYTKVHNPEIKAARQWLEWISLQDKGEIPFRWLTFAEQRLVLIARALIKRPKLLILDEPTQGLDDTNRNTLLELLEKIVERRLATIIFVSHRRDEQRPFFRQRIRLDNYSTD